MINYFRTLGESILIKENYFDSSLSDIEKKKILLNHMMIVPENRKEDVQKAIALCFDTKKEEFWFELDKEICESNAGYFFAFSLSSKPNSKKLLLSTLNTSLDTFFGKIVEDYEKLFSDKTQLVDEVIKRRMVELKDLFYKNNESEYILDSEKLREDQKEFFLEIPTDKKEMNTKDKFLYLIKNHIIPGQKDLPQIVFIKINGKTIMEDENIRDSYINIVWNTFMKDDGKQISKCHICGEEKNIIKDVEFPLMKFYGTTNQLFFENISKSKAHKSFSSCSDCLNAVLTGMNFVQQKLEGRVFNIRSFIVPKLQCPRETFQKDYRRTFKLLRNDKDGDQDTLMQIGRLLDIAEKENFYFDMIFYDKSAGKADFSIIKIISEVEYKRILNKFKNIEEINQKYGLRTINSHVDWNFIRYALFPSKSSHSKADPKLYRKEILELLESFILGRSINYENIVSDFVEIWHKKLNGSKDSEKYVKYDISAFKMNLILSIFNNIRPLSGVKNMEGKAVTKIQNQRYNEFFNEHSEIYGDSFYRQGLFLLGTIVNKIIWAQKGKTATFIKKINMRGLPPRRIQSLIGEIKEYSEIYKKDIYEEPGIWGNIMDRLQGIEKSILTAEEVVFYILSGISFDKYEAFINGKQKHESTEDGEDNDNN